MIIIADIKKKPNIKAVGTPRGERVALWLLCFFLLGYFLRAPSLASASVKAGLDVCAKALIPSLFPFAVLVGMINGSGMSEKMAEMLGRPVGRILGIPDTAVSAVLLGCLGGFPIGAVCVRELYESGSISRSDAERLVGFVNNASPAFCIGTLGMSMFGSTEFGASLYFCQLAAALTVGMLFRRGYSPRSGVYRGRISSAADTLTGAISSAGLTMLKICAFAVFFAVLGDAVCMVAERYFGEAVAAVCAAVCEITLAGRKLSALVGSFPKILCAFTAGWSGISVHMQTASVLSGSGIGMRRYYVSRLIIGGLSAFYMLLYLSAAGDTV